MMKPRVSVTLNQCMLRIVLAARAMAASMASCMLVGDEPVMEVLVDVV